MASETDERSSEGEDFSTEQVGIVAGIDIGGTFTDAVVMNPATGELSVAKATTTPRAPVEGLLDALARTGVELSQVTRLFHGTTLGLNTALERSGATVGLITSEGSRDVLEIGRMSWPMYSLHSVQAAPLVPRYLRREIPERVTAHGTVVTDFTDADVIAAVRELLAEGAELVAVSLLHSYAHAHNEKRVGAIIESEFPGLGYSLSHEVACEYREFERTVTTVVEATTKPKLGKYFEDLRDNLVQRGFTGELFITRSDGGLMSVAEARNSCVQTLVSGPASGIAGAADLGNRIGSGDVLTIDVGGTSFDAALIRDGKPVLQAMTDITGLPRLLMPSIEIATIGAGGGSIAFIDAAGTLNVGPRSANAEPGPVCYGRGGTEPTFTDAALVSGLLDAASFLGGRMPLDEAAAREAIRVKIAEPLGLGIEEAASGIVAIAEVKMAHKLDEITIEKGIDPRELTMVAYGGGGPLAADALASRVGVKRVVVPQSPGMFSAGGALTLDVTHTYSQTVIHPLDTGGLELLKKTIGQLATDAHTKLDEDEIEPSRQRFFASADLRYDLQEHALTIAIDGDVDQLGIGWLESAFHEAHEAHYGYRLTEPVELVACRVRGLGLLDKASIDEFEPEGTDSTHAFLGTRSGVHRESGGAVEFSVFDRRVLRPGNVLVGPALIEEDSTTTLVSPGRQVTVDSFANLVITDATTSGN